MNQSNLTCCISHIRFSRLHYYSPIMKSKECPDCITVKPLSQFGINKNSPDGLNWYCKQCAARKRKESRQTNSLSHWLHLHSDCCAKCGSVCNIKHVWLLDYMLPVAICEPCSELYDTEFKATPGGMKIGEFYDWLRKKTCASCGHIWLARAPKPHYCPKCKSHDWNVDDDG